jgi:hypothetical protein
MSLDRIPHAPCASPAQHDEQARRQIADEQMLEAHAADWTRWFREGTAAGELACDLPECDGDAWEAVAGLIASALRRPWSNDNRMRAEEVVTALARLAADREMQA